jgi:hypothetical protein
LGRHAAASDSREIRQAAWRDVNANIAGLADRLGAVLGDAGRGWTFLCECGGLECHDLLTATLAVYRAARAHGSFLVAPGHEAPADVVVERAPEYVVVAPG